MKIYKIIVLIFLTLFLDQSFAITLSNLKLPPGFAIEIFSKEVPNARSMALGSQGTVFVSTRNAGKVYAIVTQPNNQRKVITIASGLNEPNGIVFANGSLYIAETDKLIRFDHIEDHLDNPPKPVLITDKFPKQDHHSWKYLRMGPDGKLYISIGAPCNVCLSEDERFATIMRLNPDGSDLEIFAKGVRNSIGFDWDPATKEFWFTDNTRDWMGDNLPPEELNHAPKAGLHFGFPYYHAEIPDPEFGKLRPLSDFVKPVFTMPAHTAPLGMIFYTGKMFPAEYHNQILIAQHGSWNRSTKIGYQVILVTLKDGKVVSSKPFLTGFLKWQLTMGRPVDFLVLPDGSLLISDDFNGYIYRISYK